MLWHIQEALCEGRHSFLEFFSHIPPAHALIIWPLLVFCLNFHPRRREVCDNRLHPNVEFTVEPKFGKSS